MFKQAEENALSIIFIDELDSIAPKRDEVTGEVERRVVDLKELAGITHGYVGADMAALCKEAAMRSLRRILPEIDLQVDNVPPEVLNRLEVTRDDFLQAYREMEPSTMREVLIEKPNVRWGDIGGLDEAKQELRESIEWPLTMNKLFAHFDARPP